MYKKGQKISFHLYQMINNDRKYHGTPDTIELARDMTIAELTSELRAIQADLPTNVKASWIIH